MSTVKKITSQKITKEEAEQLLQTTYRMKYVTVKYPGYPSVSGRCDRIIIGEKGTKDEGMVLIFINDRRYSISPESLRDCLTLLKPDE